MCGIESSAGIELAMDCLAASIREQISWQDEHRLVEEGDVLFAVGTGRFPTGYTNTALPLSRDVDAREVLERVADFYARLERPYVIWAVAELHVGLEQAALSAGLSMVSEMPAMAVRERLPERPAPAGIELETVVDEKGLADLIEVCVEAYEEMGLPPHVMRSYFARPGTVLAAGNHLVLARCGGEPVAAALSVTSGAKAGVCWVGTRPERRGLGAGEACTRAVTNAAFDRGASVVALEASRMGEPIYRRMGYDEVGRYRWYLGGTREARVAR